MSSPIAYTYDADTHCPACAFKRFGAGIDDLGTKDGEGNSIGSIYGWEVDSEQLDAGIYCGDCNYECYPPADDYYVDDEEEYDDSFADNLETDPNY